MNAPVSRGGSGPIPFIEIRDVVRTYRDPKRGRTVDALAQVSLDLDRNEFLCLLGPSGCGKSTLLNMIAGFDFPTRGSVRVGGVRVESPGEQRGMVFQQPTLMPWLPVWENVAFSLRLKGADAGRRRRAAQTCIDMVGLQGFENHYPFELSGGMSQRVGIARALLMNPEVILMDEPFAALDSQTKLEMQEELVGIWQRQRGTVVFVTHSVDEALILATRIAVMTYRPGRIREEITVDLDRPRDVTSPEFNRLKRHILGLIREESQRARAEQQASR